MLKLIQCEFLKLKRKKFIFITMIAAFLFPIPLTVFASTSNLGFDWLYLNVGVYGYFLLLPTVLGILGAMIFFAERDNSTEKNINTIPITIPTLILAKISVLIFFAVFYSLATNIATIIGGVIIGEVSKIFYNLLISILIAIMVCVAVFPVFCVECVSNKGYIFAVILSLAYSVISFGIVFAMSNIFSPLSAVFRWALPHMTSGPTYGLDDWFFSTPACVGVLILTASASLFIAVFYKNRQEI